MGSVVGRFVRVAIVGLAMAAPPAWAEDGEAAATCDTLAASPLDPNTPAGAGVLFADVNAKAAVAACAAAVAADPADIKRVYQLGRANDAAELFDEAIANYRAAADQGYAMAANALGALYEGGYGLEMDAAEAARLYQQAADDGIVVAMENLAKLYEDGNGVAQDYVRAAALYQQAAAAGSAYASGALGWLTENGHGVDKDLAEAVRLYQIAADGGEAFAQNNLGAMHANGLGGLTQNNAEAIKYYRLAADQGWARAYLNLAWHHSHGEGVERDVAKAEDYLERVLTEGDEQLQGDARNDLAWLFATENTRLDEAETLAREAVAAGPEIANRIDTLAWVLHLRGEDQAALPLAEKAVALDGKDAVFAEHLAAIAAALGK